MLDKDYELLEQLGLTLAEAEALLLAVQRQVLDRLIAAAATLHWWYPALLVDDQRTPATSLAA